MESPVLNSPMRITMLGTMGVGKTTFLTAMYQEMGYEGRSGFYLKTDTATDKFLTGKWNEMIETFVWPQPTPDYRAFDFDLVFGTKFIKKFSFVDYRGGSLRGVETDDKQAEKLMEDIDRSDCLLILADSYYIANSHKYIATARNELQIIQSFLDKYITSHPQKYLSIGVILTKIDLVPPENYEDFRHRCFTVFKNLTTLTLNHRPRVEFSYIPISVTGYGNCSIDVTMQGNMPVVTCKLTDFPDPLFVSWPVLYSVKKSFEFRQREISALKKALNSDRTALKNRDWIDKFVAVLRGEKLTWFRELELVEQLDKLEEENKAIEDRVTHLVTEVNVLGDGWREQLYMPNGHH